MTHAESSSSAALDRLLGSERRPPWYRRAWLGWLALLLIGLAAGWWAILMIAHLPMQVDNPLARVVGGDFRGWTVFGLLAAVVLGYREVLRAVRRRKVEEPVPAPRPGTFREAELDRLDAALVGERQILGCADPDRRVAGAKRIAVTGKDEAHHTSSPSRAMMSAAISASRGLSTDHGVRPR